MTLGSGSSLTPLGGCPLSRMTVGACMISSVVGAVSGLASVGRGRVRLVPDARTALADVLSTPIWDVSDALCFCESTHAESAAVMTETTARRRIIVLQAVARRFRACRLPQ